MALEQQGQLFTSASQAKPFVEDCLETWEQGGKGQVHTALQDSLTYSGSGLKTPHTSTLILLNALLSAHTLHPRILPATFSTLLSNLIDSNPVKDDLKADSSSSSSPNASEPGEGLWLSLSSALLDAVWAVDLEIDSRKEFASVSDCSLLGEGSSSKETLDEQTKAAKVRLADIVRELLSQNLLTRADVSERLEVSLLAQIGLVENEVAFNKRLVRLNTATLYRQQKFNLLREENEGYSGLINELVGGMGPPIRALRYDDLTDRLVEQDSAEEKAYRAKGVMNNVSALIGYFDLDPNRVLDIFLDVFSSNVVRHWPFFLALLSVSPWGGARRQTKRKADGMDVDVFTHDSFGLINVDMSSDQGHNVVAQILGFKFGFYQQQDVSDPVPDDLYLMTALLIREGHVRFVDLYSHLSPSEKGMAALHEKYKQSMSDKVSSAKGNALSMAAPLTEEGSGLNGSNANGGADGTAGTDADSQKEPPNQILGLLKALLGIGHIKGAMMILGRYPWLCGAYPHIADLYIRLINKMIEPAYSSISLAKTKPAASHPGLSVARLRFDNKKQELVKIAPPILRITSQAPEPLATLTSRFVYFYGAWEADLPLCLRVDDFLEKFVPLLRLLGPHIYRSPALFQRVCRIVKSAITSSHSDGHDYSSWLEVVRNILLPGLTMASGNSGLVSEVWAVLLQLPYTERYNIYGEWKYALYRRPELRARQAETEKEAKGILKRISSDNVKLSGRSLAKSSHTNPTTFFTVALNQIQSYSNLIAPIVESAKYLTHFEYDVFGFNLIDALSNPEKERTKQDGTSVSMWLQSLAAFTGTLYKRYAMMDCSPVLQYIANQLKENNIKDLVIVRELILKMAGIEPLANLSDAQVAALTGGRLLRMEAMMIANASVATPARVQLRKSGARLLTALMESRMVMPLLILIAQQRQACVHLVDAAEAHLKYLGNLFDTCQEILFQYIEFLHNQLELQAYSDLIPTLRDLCIRFEMDPAIAFHIARPRLVLQLRLVEAKENEMRLRKEVLASKAQSQEPAEAKEGAVKLEDADEEMTEVDTSDKAAKGTDGDLQDTLMEELAAGADDTKQTPQAEAIWKAGVQEAVDAADSILSDEAKELIGVNFYATFWQLGLADITVPTERYEQELQALQRIIDQNPEGGRKSIHKARVQAQDMHRQLRDELREQTLSHQTTRKRLLGEKDHWFADVPVALQNRSAILYQLMQHCIVPRALLSPTDAIFAGRFLRLMHSIATRNFSTLTAYDKIIMEQVAPLVFSSTENEIRNYARFLQIILDDVNRWYRDEDKFIKEAHGDKLPGFQMKWGDRHGGEEIPASDMLSYDKLKAVTHKWHSMLRSVFRECLCSKEYMRIRNTIVVMTRIAPQYPLFEAHGSDLLESIQSMTQEEERGDLKILGQGLLATLKKQQKTWIGVKKKPAATAAATGAANPADKEKILPVAPASAAEELRETTRPTIVSADSEKLVTKVEPGVDVDEALKKDKAGADKEETKSKAELNGKEENRSRAPSETATTRDAPSGRPSLSRHTSSSTPAARESSAPDVQAARRAALESMSNGSNSGPSMNPPRSSASTAGAQAARDRHSSTHQRDRDRERPSSSAPHSREKDRQSSSHQQQQQQQQQQGAERHPSSHARERDRGFTASTTMTVTAPADGVSSSAPRRPRKDASRSESYSRPASPYTNSSRSRAEEPLARRESGSNGRSSHHRDRDATGLAGASEREYRRGSGSNGHSSSSRPTEGRSSNTTDRGASGGGERDQRRRERRSGQ